MRYSVLMQAFKPCLPAVWAILVFSMIINLLMLTGSLYMLQIYDRVLSSGSVPTLAALPSVFLAPLLPSPHLSLLPLCFFFFFSFLRSFFFVFLFSFLFFFFFFFFLFFFFFCFFCFFPPSLLVPTRTRPPLNSFQFS